MACYTFTLGNKEFTISNSINTFDATSGTAFLQALQQVIEKDKNTYMEIIKTLGELQISPNVEKLTSKDKKDIPYIVQANLLQYGITLNILKSSSTDTQLSWNDFCLEHNINPDTKAFVFQGQIYINEDSFDMGATMHELTHLFLAVLKTNDFKKYLNLIHILFLHPVAQVIAKEIQNIPTYSLNADLDFEEEAIVRMFEQIYNGQDISLEFDVNGETIDVLNLFETELSPIIQLTLGISKYPGILTFMQSMLVDLPSYLNAFLNQSRLSSSTNTMIEQTAKETAGISNLINFLSQDNLPIEFAEEKIEKGDCK